MRTDLTLRVVLILCATNVNIRADEKPGDSPEVVVGSVYGQEITAKDIGLTAPIDPTLKFDARDLAWNLMSRISTKFGSPVMERFVNEQKIEATAEEIAKFNRSMRKINEKQILKDAARLTELSKQLESDDLSKEAREKLVIQQKQLTENLKFQQDAPKDPPVEFAKSMILSWKIERELHRKYGGRVIFQQFGCEALDARKKLYEEAEKNGDLKFEDAGVRHMFYYYSNMQHTFVDAKALENAWFLNEAE